MLGKRIGFGREAMAPHSLTMTMIGASLLWFGWFGFNAGSALSSDGLPAQALVNTHLAAAAAMITWLVVEKLLAKHATTLGAASGAVAGLVAITPASGFVTPGGAVVIGLLAGGVCYSATLLRERLDVDDALDVFAVMDVLAARGWHLDRQRPPDSIHATVSARVWWVVSSWVQPVQSWASR